MKFILNELFSGYAKGYNMLHKDKSGLNYMPEGMEGRDFFQDSDSSNE